MYNHVFLIGRTTDKPVIKTLENGQIVGRLTLAVNRPYKNSNGEYDTDFIPCTLWNGVATNCSDYINKGSLVGVKGLLVQKDENVYFKKGEEEYKKKISVLEVYADSVVFLKL